MYGWAGKRLKVYLTEGEIVKEELSDDFKREYLGGEGFNAKTLYDETRPGIDPLGPENVFCLGAGPLSGTIAPGTTRWTATAKSPLTGLFCDGNGGGHFTAELKFAGYDQIVLYGRSPKPVYLWINNDRVELRDASHLWGKTTWDTHYTLLKELGDREISTLTIGPAGENLVRVTKVYVNTTRAGGKGGMGAVMGSKNVKAVAVRGTGSVKIARPEPFYKAVRTAVEKTQAHPFAQVLRTQGTIYLPRFMNQFRALTTRNAQAGYFEGWEKITAEVFEENYAVKHTACYGCLLACSHYYEVKDGPYAAHGCANQYGTLYPFTSKCGSDNLAASLYLTTLCDQLGIDTHACGGTIAFAMEAWQRGLLTSKDTDGLDLTWGNVESIVKLVRKIAYRDGFGNILADGSRGASRKIPGSEACLVESKGYEISYYYPGEGESPITGLAHAVSPVGGSGHRGGFMGLQSHSRVKKALPKDVAERLAAPPAVPESGGQPVFQKEKVYEGQGVVLAVEQDYVAAQNSAELCQWLSLCGLNEHDMARMISAASGLEIDGDEVLKVGERVVNVERAYSIREGVRRKDDTLPKRFFGEKDTPYGTVGLDEAKFQKMLDEYYQARGWDNEGIPTRKKLEELNLAYIAAQIPAK